MLSLGGSATINSRAGTAQLIAIIEKSVVSYAEVCILAFKMLALVWNRELSLLYRFKLHQETAQTP